MKKIFKLISFLALSFASYSQIQNIKIGYQEFPTLVTGHASDSLGNMYYSGSFKGELTVDKQVLETGAGLDDIFLVKINKVGKVIFSKSFGSKSDDQVIANGLCYANRNVYLAAQVTDDISFQSISVTPYASSTQSVNTGCIANFDSSGNVKWVSKTSIAIAKIYIDRNIIHVLGSIARGDIMFNNKLLSPASPVSSMVHLMLDTSGNLSNFKVVSLTKAGQNFQSPLFLSSYSDGKLSMLLAMNGGSSFQFGKKTISIPDQSNIYYILIKTDTSYSDISYKLLNPAGLNFNNTNGPGLTMNLSKKDSTYLILTSSNASPTIDYDGLNVPVYNNNVLVVLDSSLKAARIITLGSFIETVGNINTRRLIFKTINISGNNLLLTGTFIGKNQSPIRQIPQKQVKFKITPNLETTVDLNGPTTGFLAKASLGFSNTSLTDLGDYREYENTNPYYTLNNVANDSLLVLSLKQDNTWNPRIINFQTSKVYGSIMPNADLADRVQFVEYLEDGSRIVLGSAQGKTALDTSGNGIKSNQQRSDAFIARIASDRQVKWYKRFYSTLVAASPGKLMLKEKKAYFLINYFGSVNDSNYIVVDGNTYSLNNDNNASLLANIDTSGNIHVINQEINSIRKARIADFNFFKNNDLIILTGLVGYMPFASFPNNNGSFLFRINPTANSLVSTRKLILTDGYSYQPSAVAVDNNDILYVSNPYISSGPQQNKNQTLFLHDGSKFIDSLTYENNVTGVDFQGLGILKINGNKFSWYKRSSGDNGFFVDGARLSVSPINGKINFAGFPTPSFSGDLSAKAFYWDKKLILPDMRLGSTYIFSMDSAGVINKQKSILDFQIRYNKTKGNDDFIISGSTAKATMADTISIGFDGSSDAVGLVIDSSFKTVKSFRLATPFFEFLNDMDIYKDSIASFAYYAQSAPSFYTNRTSVVATDNEADAFLASQLLKKATVLAIELVSFTGQRKEAKVNLEWTINSNEEGRQFVIERAESSRGFQELTTIQSIDRRALYTYRTTDDLIHYGNYYYRLKITSKDGKITYSNILYIAYPPKESSFYYDFTVQRLHISRTNNVPYYYRILDASGKTIVNGEKVTGNQTVALSKLAPGIYSVQTFDKTSSSKVFKFVR